MFTDALVDTRKEKERAITKLCTKYYREFLESIDEFKEMKKMVTDLKLEVFYLCSSFSNNDVNLMTILNNVEEYCMVYDKCEVIQKSIYYCKQVVNAMCIVTEALKNNDFYEATKYIEILQKEVVILDACIFINV